MEKLKKCSKCGRELPVSEFWKNASTEDGLQTYCKECGNVYAKNRKKTPGGGLKKIYGKSSVSCPLKPSDSAPLKHSTMPP